MVIYIITHKNSRPGQAFLNQDEAYKAYKKIKEENEKISNDYEMVVLPIEGTSKPVVEADAESRCPLYVDYKKSCMAWQDRKKELIRTTY